jgi:hypothetical protein
MMLVSLGYRLHDFHCHAVGWAFVRIVGRIPDRVYGGASDPMRFVPR